MNGSLNDKKIGEDDGNYALLRFMVNPNLNFLSRAEVEQINSIVKLGAFLKMIQTFLAKFGGISSKMAIELAYKDEENKKVEDGEVNHSLDGPAD